MTIGSTRALSAAEVVEIIQPYRMLIAASIEAAESLPTWDDGTVGDAAAEFLGRHPTLVRVIVAAGTGATIEDADQLPSDRRMQIFTHICRLTRGDIGVRGVAIAIMDDLAPLSPWIAKVRAENP
jgi:hypothetical protein